MLKNIPPLLSPELLKALCEMGHGDRLIIADGNFPAESKGKNHLVIRCDGHGVPEILDAILQVFPLDNFVDKSAFLMQVPEPDAPDPVIWKQYREIVGKYEKQEYIDTIAKPDFMQEAEKAYLIIASSEKALYANIMLQKGCI
ncbi:MAG: fucose isomerase [Atopobium sp.]|nr:fucose isomerase [Atopobium sp.]